MTRVDVGLWFPILEVSRLCLRCRDQGVIAETDWAPLEPLCRGHLAEDRINEFLAAAGMQLDPWQRQVLEQSYTARRRGLR